MSASQPTKGASQVSVIQTTPENPSGTPPIGGNRPHSAIECPRCDAWWGGLSTAHCSACHRTFTGITAFDRHRDGKHTDDTRHCVDPETVGLVDAGRAYPCWGFPGNDRRWADQ